MQKVTVTIRKQRAPNGIPRQPSKRNAKEYGPVPYPNLSNGGDLGDERGEHGDEGSGGETVEHAEDDDGCVRGGGNPEPEYDYGGEGGRHDHYVESTDSVSDYSGEDTAEDTGRCQHVVSYPKMRASYEAAFRMGITYMDKLADIPWLWALITVSQGGYEGLG